MNKISLFFVFCAFIAAFFAFKPQVQDEKAPEQSNNNRQCPIEEPPFWEQAIVPEPEKTRSTIREPRIEPPKLASPDPEAEVMRLAAAGDSTNLNYAFAAWFDLDPHTARDWLAAQSSMDGLQPAITMVAGKIAQDGDPANGLEWAELLDPGPQQEQTLFDIYSLAARGNQFTEEQLKSAALPAARIAELLGGAVGD